VTVTALFLAGTIGWPYEAWLFPVAIAVPTLTVACFQLAQEAFTVRRADEIETYADIKSESAVTGSELTHRAVEAFAWVLGLLGGVYVVGFPLAITVFLLTYLRFRAKESWRYVIGLTAILVGLLYLFFDHVLHVVWPEGMLGIG